MEIIGWHGGWGNFRKIDQQYFGTGEGDSDGWGFYLAQNRKGGEYFCDYARCTKGKGFLHRVSIHIDESELWNNYVQDDFITANGEIMTYDNYRSSRNKLGDREAALTLSQRGVSVINNPEEHKPRHGETFIVLAIDKVVIHESYEYVERYGMLFFNRVI